jgi:hypothetical protein
MKIWGLWLLPLLAGCMPHADMPQTGPAAAVAPAQMMFPANVMPHIGDTVTGHVQFLNREMTLPAGAWKVASTQAMMAKTTGLAAAAIALIRVQGTSLQSILVFGGNARPVPNGFAANKLCQSSDVIWNDVAQNTPQGDQDCSTVNFERTVLWRMTGKNVAAGVMNQLDLLNVQPPNIMVSVMAHEANRNWTLDEFLFENPDLAGITPDLSTQRAQSSWVGFRAASDPARQKFIDDLKTLAAPMRAALRRQIATPAPYLPGTGLTPA